MPGRNAPSSRFNLRFGPAITPEQRVGYEELYPVFVAVRNLISGEAGVKETSLPKAKKGYRSVPFREGTWTTDSRGDAADAQKIESMTSRID